MQNNATINGTGMEDDDPVVSESESESEEGEDVKLSEPSKTAVYNKDGLLDKLGDISWPENVDWRHKLSVDIDQEQEVDVNDDLTRELAFYTQALEGARQAFAKFQSMGLPFLRPSDYYAEMVKSDAHMEKVKGRLLAEKRKIEEAEERKKARENKKLAKEMQVQKQRERAKQKKEEIESVKNWRKQRKQSGFAGGDKDGDFSLAFEDGKSFERSSKRRPGVAPGDRSGGKAKQGGGKGKKGFDKKRKDREFRDSKFGFGGKKGLKKQNTSETTNDFRAFSKSNFPKQKKQKV
ncbi:putative rRNA-processing protein EBP2 [Sesamum alatum]|uniref:rRNA-processing protein EBP2 n=1 Tax=Sesamum alatum TaxID=300844 RepID=A0AAE2CEH8_9LAMI|nr:putative rRNA-processing protein EBP2 [Sesamum alatum]